MKKRSDESNRFGFGAVRAVYIGMSMQNRLATLMITGVFLMAVIAVISLYMTGLFHIGRANAEKYIEKEFITLYSELSAQYGSASVQLVSLSQHLSRSMENHLAQKQIPVRALKDNPGVLEEIIENELDRLKLAFERTKCSGVFMVLDATVNPALDNAEHSKAGIYIKANEPAMPGAPAPTYLYLRGFPNIAYVYGLHMQAKWKMEFDVENRDYYHLPIRASESSSLPLSAMFYWGMESMLTRQDDAMLVCSIPLLDSGGNPFGVCGFVISAENFMYNFAPGGEDFKDIAAIFGVIENGALDTRGAMFAGGNAAVNGIRGAGGLSITAGDRLNVYKAENGNEYYGLHRDVKLYSNASALKGETFAAALLVSKGEIDASVNQGYIRLILICMLMTAIGVGLSFFVSRRYIRPIRDALNVIGSDNLDGAAKTNIAEIDDLLLYLKSQDEKRRAELNAELERAKKELLEQGEATGDDQAALNLKDFEQFLENLKTLTEAERSVFNHYTKKMSAHEIADAMFVSINTIRFHNRNIYKKLGVSSLKEMEVYMRMMKETRDE